VKAAVAADGAIHIEERPDPEPGVGQVLVRVRAAGINGADLLQMRGGYAAPPGDPQDVPGLELAGEVVALGPDAFRFEIGDRVMALVGGGGQAELAAVHERIAMPVPDELDWVQAGGFVEVFATAHDAIFTQAGLGSGERLLVQGAAGGVGLAAVQLAREAGASVTATVRAEPLREAVAEFGAEVRAPGELDGCRPFDVVLELVGGAANLVADVASLAIGGRLAVIGLGAGGTAELDFRQLMVRRARLMASTLRARPLEEKALVVRRLERHVLPLLEAGRVTVPVEEAFPLATAQAAYDRFEAGGKLGKIVLEIE
jgi:NADPH:quinone reductase